MMTLDRRVSRRTALQLLAAAPSAAWSPAAAHGIDRVVEQNASRTLRVGLFSRHLQWTSVEDAIDVAHHIGFDAIEWAVRPGGHIDPARVETDLPKVVELTRNAGLSVPMIATDIVDAQSPRVEAILETAHGLGMRYYRSAMFRYDYTSDLERQLEALKPRVAALADLNRQHSMTIAYHTHSGRGNIGGNVWDLWLVIRSLDPQLVALNYDTAHTAIRGGNGWADAAHAALKYIRCLAVKDFTWTRAANGTAVAEFCPLGTGMVDFKAVFALLRSASFNGPINLHLEHSNLLGSDVGKWKLDITRDRFIAIVKRDLDALRTMLRDAQLN